VNGTFVVDGVVGDWLCARYGLLAATPLTIEIAGNRIVSCASTNKRWKKTSGPTRTPMKTPTAWASLPSAPTWAWSE
jgi:hypothetical protein